MNEIFSVVPIKQDVVFRQRPGNGIEFLVPDILAVIDVEDRYGKDSLAAVAKRDNLSSQREVQAVIRRQALAIFRTGNDALECPGVIKWQGNSLNAAGRSVGMS